MILVVCALGCELPGITERPNVHVLETGIGPVEAALAAACALADGRYKTVVSAGIAGGFVGRAAPGECVAVAEECFSGLAREDGSALVLPEGAAIQDTCSADAALIARTGRAGMRAVRGVTVSSVTATDRTARRLRTAYRADVETMEGFAVFRAASRAGIPVVGIRGISNRVGDRAKAGWDFLAAANAASSGLRRFLETLDDAQT